MKKIVLSVALVAMMGVSFVSCKDTAKEPAVEVEATTEEVVAPEVVTEEVAPEVVTEEVVAPEAAATTEEVKEVK